jgi:hypothetical protein
MKICINSCAYKLQEELINGIVVDDYCIGLPTTGTIYGHSDNKDNVIMIVGLVPDADAYILDETVLTTEESSVDWRSSESVYNTVADFMIWYNKQTVSRREIDQNRASYEGLMAEPEKGVDGVIDALDVASSEEEDPGPQDRDYSREAAISSIHGAQT